MRRAKILVRPRKVDTIFYLFHSNGKIKLKVVHKVPKTTYQKKKKSPRQIGKRKRVIANDMIFDIHNLGCPTFRYMIQDLIESKDFIFPDNKEKIILMIFPSKTYVELTRLMLIVLT